MKRKLRILAIAFLATMVVGVAWAGITSLASGQAVDVPPAERLRVISEETGLVASERRGAIRRRLRARRHCSSLLAS